MYDILGFVRAKLIIIYVNIKTVKKSSDKPNICNNIHKIEYYQFFQLKQYRNMNIITYQTLVIVFLIFSST